jgi:hypothetical protein
MRENEIDDALPGQDSFVDVVCNMVGILIVLVVILGVRSAGGEPEPSPSSAVQSLVSAAVMGADADSMRAAMAIWRQEIGDNASRIQQMMLQSALTESRRNELNVLLAAAQAEIAERRSKLDAEGQRQFDTQAAIAAANLKLQGLTEEQARLLAQSVQVVELEHVPTVLSKSITGDVIFVRLAHGNLAVVPVDELVGQYIGRSRDYLRNEIGRSDHAGGVFGPINGFMMRHLLVKDDVSQESPPGGPRGAPVSVTYRERRAFRPTFDRIGEPIDQALLSDSQFMRTLNDKSAVTQAVLVFVYPNSYEELGKLKQALWKQNISISIIPLRNGEDIVLSSDGIRPRAQ